MFIVDTKQKYLRINDLSAEFMKIHPNDVQGKSVAEVFDDLTAREWRQFDERFKQPVVIEERVVTGDLTLVGDSHKFPIFKQTGWSLGRWRNGGKFADRKNG